MAKPIQRIDRRRFLLGAGGSMLALPMLQMFAPRRAFAEPVASPKRVVLVVHHHGRMVGHDNSSGAALPEDGWSPNAGAYPATGDLSPLLAALGPIRDSIVTLDRIDNRARHMSPDSDGHLSASLTSLTCVPPTADLNAGGPSFDRFAGELLRASPAQEACLVFPSSVTHERWRYEPYAIFGAGGTPPTVVDTNPLLALEEVFGPPTARPTDPPPVKTLTDRMSARRGSILDAVAGDFSTLAANASASDRQQLEQHAEFIRALETKLGGGGDFGIACERPDEAAIPAFDASANPEGQLDPVVTPWQIENLVMALACDITRAATLHFWHTAEYATYESEFGGASPIAPGQLHNMIHNGSSSTSGDGGAVAQGFQMVGKLFTQMIQRMAEIIEPDGTRLLDNTLVIWTSELGSGAHWDFNMPVVLAGLPSAFTNGQGRHVLPNDRHSMGDVFTQALAMLGFADQTFGYVGRVGDTGLSGYEGLNQYTCFGGPWGDTPFITEDLPLHAGPLDL